MKELINELQSYDGRFSRSQYWLSTIGINIVSRLLIEIADIIPNDTISIILILGIVIPSIYFQICIQIKRAHDLDKSGHFIWLNYIPLVNIYSTVLLAFFKGTNGPNTYGKDPLIETSSEVLYEKE